MPTTDLNFQDTNVIDLTADDSTSDVPTSATGGPISRTDDDVEITSWTRTRAPSRHHTSLRAPDTLEPFVRPSPNNVFTSTATSSRLPTSLPAFARSRHGSTAWQQQASERQTIAQQVAARMNPRNFLETFLRNAPVFRSGLPDLDYDHVGFDLHVNDDSSDAENDDGDGAPLEPLPALQDGFTREINEGDVLVCPNCDGELARGDEIQQLAIWIIKACGHVYCGTCGDKSNRSGRTSKAKGKAKVNKREDGTEVKPLSTCAVEGCQSKVTNSDRSMFCLYL